MFLLNSKKLYHKIIAVNKSSQLQNLLTNKDTAMQLTTKLKRVVLALLDWLSIVIPLSIGESATPGLLC